MSGHLSRDNRDTCHVTKGHDNPPSLEGVMSCHVGRGAGLHPLLCPWRAVLHRWRWHVAAIVRYCDEVIA